MLKDFFRIGMTPGCLLSLLIFNTVVEVLAGRKKKKPSMYIQNRKKRTKLSLFVSNMINFFQNSNTPTHKILELMKEIS